MAGDVFLDRRVGSSALLHQNVEVHILGLIGTELTELRVGFYVFMVNYV